MKYRLLALDLDGTLLNSQKEITPEVRKALAWAKERGVYVVLCWRCAGSCLPHD